MNESWPCSRLMPLPWPWRSLAAYCWRLGDMRSIAPSRLSPPDSDCGTERNGARTGGRRSAGHAESSGVKRSEPDGVRPAISKAVGGISTKQSAVKSRRLPRGSKTKYRRRNYFVCPAFSLHSSPSFRLMGTIQKSGAIFCSAQNKISPGKCAKTLGKSWRIVRITTSCNTVHRNGCKKLN
jgi:hypothetical protein